MKLLSLAIFFISLQPIISSSIPQPFDTVFTLEKRKGGGGGGGGKGGGGGGSSSSGSGSGRSSGSSSSGSSSKPASGSGTTSSRPGVGGVYRGGSPSTFVSGKKTPRGITPLLLPVSGLLFFGGALWLYGSVNSYPYRTEYTYTDTDGDNRTVSVRCLCQRYGTCGCEDTGNTTYLQNIIGENGPRNRSGEVVVLPREDNGTQLAYINGTLENGTTNNGEAIVASGAGQTIMKHAGYWVVAGSVFAAGSWL